MSASRFVYVTYIRTTPENLWHALTSPEFTQRYWYGVRMESSLRTGSDWKLMIPDGRVGDSGKVIESDPPRKLVVTWRNEFIPEMTADGYSRCTFELEPVNGAVKLTITHESDKPESKLISAVSNGWPAILSSLKSLLETGDPLPGSSEWSKGV
jgi:uncharacterized protein YndB with AHSA1/START domain